MELFKINDLVFTKEDFLEDISEFEDIIDIVKELQDNLSFQEIQCVGENDCCEKTNKNYIVEIQGFINSDDEFITKEELENGELNTNEQLLESFVIRLYKCLECGKWIIDILE